MPCSGILWTTNTNKASLELEPKLECNTMLCKKNLWKQTLPQRHSKTSRLRFSARSLPQKALRQAMHCNRQQTWSCTTGGSRNITCALFIPHIDIQSASFSSSSSRFVDLACGINRALWSSAYSAQHVWDYTKLYSCWHFLLMSVALANHLLLRNAIAQLMVGW